MSFNLKGHMDGKLMDGKMNGEFDLTLPNKYYAHGKLDRQVKTKDNIINANAHLVLEAKTSKDAPKACTFDIKGKAVDTNIKEHVFDYEFNIVAKDHTDKDVKVDLVLKHKHDGDKKKSLYKVRFIKIRHVQPQNWELLLITLNLQRTNCFELLC